jgi:hypothetical protein
MLVIPAKPFNAPKSQTSQKVRNVRRARGRMLKEAAFAIF